MGERERPAEAAASTATGLQIVRDPVIAILLLAGLFDGISDNWIHAALLWLVAAVLSWEAFHGRALDEPAGQIGWAGPFAHPLSAGRRLGTLGALSVAIAYAWLGGSFGRYSVPMTAVIVLPAAAVLALGWPRPGTSTTATAPLGALGATAWGALFLAACLLELTSLLLQPSFRTDSYAHPTISYLMDPLLASHAGRALGLLAWLGLGWFLLVSLARSGGDIGGTP
jgi:hypothetical protein